MENLGSTSYHYKWATLQCLSSKQTYYYVFPYDDDNEQKILKTLYLFDGVSEIIDANYKEKKVILYKMKYYYTYSDLLNYLARFEVLGEFLGGFSNAPADLEEFGRVDFSKLAMFK